MEVGICTCTVGIQMVETSWEGNMLELAWEEKYLEVVVVGTCNDKGEEKLA